MSETVTETGSEAIAANSPVPRITALGLGPEGFAPKPETPEAQAAQAAHEAVASMCSSSLSRAPSFGPAGDDVDGEQEGEGGSDDATTLVKGNHALVAAIAAVEAVGGRLDDLGSSLLDGGICGEASPVTPRDTIVDHGFLKPAALSPVAESAPDGIDDDDVTDVTIVAQTDDAASPTGEVQSGNEASTAASRPTDAADQLDPTVHLTGSLVDAVEAANEEVPAYSSGTAPAETASPEAAQAEGGAETDGSETSADPDDLAHAATMLAPAVDVVTVAVHADIDDSGREALNVLSPSTVAEAPHQPATFMLAARGITVAESSTSTPASAVILAPSPSATPDILTSTDRAHAGLDGTRANTRRRTRMILGGLGLAAFVGLTALVSRSGNNPSNDAAPSGSPAESARAPELTPDEKSFQALAELESAVLKHEKISGLDSQKKLALKGIFGFYETDPKGRDAFLKFVQKTPGDDEQRRANVRAFMHIVLTQSKNGKLLGLSENDLKEIFASTPSAQ